MTTTKCLFHVPGHQHDSCVIAQQYGKVWLVRDMETMFWVDQPSIDRVPEFAAIDDDDNYAAWCRATPASVSGFGGDGRYGIGNTGSPEFLAACREAEAEIERSWQAEAKIEGAGGIEYAAPNTERAANGR